MSDKTAVRATVREIIDKLVAPQRPVVTAAPEEKVRVAYPPAKRLYAAARQSRMQFGFGSSANASADQALAASLTQLRTRSREMVRDSAYAKRAKVIVVNNVVGAGIGLQAQVKTTRDELAKAVNDSIEWAWWEWCKADSCHTGGGLHFADMERMLMGQVFEGGEVLIRKHYRRFGTSRIPLALEVIEPERLIDDAYNNLPGITGQVRMGVELDEFERPLAYYLRSHPGDRRWGQLVEQKIVRVPADEIIHLRLIDRWPQTRGEPWLHTALRKLHDMSEYSASELAAARASSYYFGTIATAQGDNPLTTDESGSQPAMDIEPGMIQQLAPGEELNFHSPNRPNQALDPFLRHMLREVAAGIGVSYESLSRDYSQSNYSSSRLALLDDRDLWRVLQQWWIRSFREPLHREWLAAAVQSRAVTIPIDAYGADSLRYEQVVWKPRGWSWVDPAKEQDAYAAAVRNGFMTVSDVIAQTAGGLDIEDVIATRVRELKMFKEAGIEVETTVKDAPAPLPAEDPPPDDGDDQDEEPPARLFSFGR